MDVEPVYTNDLIGESSPYLLQHAHNPVQWKPWGERAFELARRLQRPIFLSIGYATCYWCHVMEREVFENLELAEWMNDRFVCVKVDREERPDVDELYMTATQVMTRRGGWPMSVFLTPPDAMGPGSRGLKPFFCGTYFPPKPMRGLAGFGQVLEAMHEAWQNQREVVLKQADELTEHVRRHLDRHRRPGTVTAAMVRRAADALMREHDAEHGGFGGAPKFPTASHLLFLLAVQRQSPTPAVHQALERTLDRMARGGLFDQIGGGFHRYSVDERWIVPHFEKMLYDNGLLLQVYAEAHEMGIAKPQAQMVMRETSDYVLREMTDISGGGGGGAKPQACSGDSGSISGGGGGAFWSAQDAEVEGREGGNYVWTVGEVAGAIEEEALRAFAFTLYGLDQGPNFRDPHDPQAKPANVLYQPHPMRPEDADKRARVNALLKAARDRRSQPRTDDKVLTAWNGMMIAGLARAGRVMGEDRFITAASQAAESILRDMTVGEDGLLRSRCRGKAHIEGFLEDYAHFSHGLLALHAATGDDRWRQLAARYTEAAIARFAAEGGGYYDTLANRSDLFVRGRGVFDGATPSGAGRMIHNLIDLGRLDRAGMDLRSYAEDLAAHAAGVSQMQHGLLRWLAASRPEGAGLARAERPRPRPRAVTAAVEAMDPSAGRYAVVVTLAPGYHVSAAPEGEGLRVGPGRVDYPPGLSRRYEEGGGVVSVYEGEVRLMVTVDRSDPPGELVVSCRPCTDRGCEAGVELVLKLGENCNLRPDR